MHGILDRRTLVRRLASAGALLAAPPMAGGCASRARSGPAAVPSGVAAPAAAPARPPRPPALEAERVRAFVGAAHGDLASTRAMLAEEPGLLNATWDWGGGDFETALGGASHMGRRDIAEHLLGAGARLDLFCAATLGMLDVVRAVVARYPDAVHWRGPHTISLLRHARAGEAAEVVAWLEARGAR